MKDHFTKTEIISKNKKLKKYINLQTHHFKILQHLTDNSDDRLQI